MAFPLYDYDQAQGLFGAGKVLTLSNSVTITGTDATSYNLDTFVTASGTPTNQQVAVWTNAHTAQGQTGLTFGGNLLTIGTSGAAGEVLLYSGNGGSSYVTIGANATSGLWGLVLPATAGTNGYFLQTDGSGNTNWVAATGTGTVNSGTSGQLAYYASSTTAVSGNADATISSGALTLGVSGSVVGQVVLQNTGSHAVTIDPSAVTSSYTFKLPATGGTNTYVLQTDGSGNTSWVAAGGSTAFSGITSGTNTNTLTVGTGGTITTSGTGTIVATAVPFNGVSAGTCANTLVVGSGGTLSTSGTGTITSTNGYSVENVKGFGATGNGATNDHTAIQNTFTAVTSANPIVYFPANASSADYLSTVSAVTDPNTGVLGIIRGDSQLCGMITSGTNNLLTLTHVSDNVGVNGYRINDISFTGNTTPTSIGSQVLVAASNANHNGGGTDVSGLQLENVQFVNSAGPAMTISDPILNNFKNVTVYGSAQGLVFNTAGTTVTLQSTFMNANLAQAYVFNGQQSIACVGTAMDSNGTGYDFNGSTCIGMIGIDGESSVAWQQTITNVVVTSGTATITVANTYSVGDTVLITGGATTNAPLNGRWKIATVSTSQFTFTTTMSNIGTNSTAGLKSSVECGDLIRMRKSSVGLVVGGIQMYTPGITQSAMYLADGTSGLTTIGGYINNSAGVTNDVIIMPAAGGHFFHSCNFGASTEANAIYAPGVQGNNTGGGANYVGINNTFGAGAITPPIMVHVVVAGNPAPATGAVIIEDSTAFASSVPLLTLTQHNSGDTGNCLVISNAGTASNDVSATNWSVTQAGLANFKGGFESTIAAGSYPTTAGVLTAGYAGAANYGQGDGTNSRRIPMTLYTGYSFGATGNVTSLTSLFASPTGSTGSLTLVANAQTVGSMIHIKASGTITVSTATMTINFSTQLNGGVCSALAIASVTTAPTFWDYEGWIYCSAVGAASTATMKSLSRVNLYSPNGTTTFDIAPAVTSLSSTVATTSTQLIDLKMDFGTTESANTCQMLMAQVELC